MSDVLRFIVIIGVVLLEVPIIIFIWSDSFEQWLPTNNDKNSSNSRGNRPWEDDDDDITDFLEDETDSLRQWPNEFNHQAPLGLTGTKFRLRITRGPNTGNSYNLDQQQILIGSHYRCDWTLFDSKVAGQHAKIWLDGNERYIKNLSGSSDLLRVNDIKYHQRALREGDIIKIGDTSIVCERVL